MTGVIVLGVVCVCLLAILGWRERESRLERRDLVDRVTHPEASQAAAFARALDTPPPMPDLDAEDDDRYGRLIPDDDYSLIGDDA